MPYFIVDLPDLTIAADGQNSNAIGNLEDAEGLMVYAPTALTGTITLQAEPTATGTTFRDITSGGSDVTIAASDAVPLTEVMFRQLRVRSSVAEAAARTFVVTKQILL